MSFSEGREGLNVPMTNLQEFFDDLEGRLSIITGLIDCEEDFGVTLEDVRRPLVVVGLPGIGKTCGIMSIRKKLNAKLPPEKQLGFKKILLGQTVVGSMTGIPVATGDGRVVRVQMPDLPDPKRDGEYGVLFLDEITTADEAQVQPALGLCDDSRNIGEYTLPEHWIVVAAGNGPDCTNFVRMDDMLISRFTTVYDIAYDYKKDWRPWAHANNINEDIIAFLNFDPTACVRVESTDMDKAGKLFPCPRTWTNLSRNLDLRKMQGRPVQQHELASFASRIVGTKAGQQFSSFCSFKLKNTEYKVEDILEGKAPDPNQGMKKEVFHILLQGIIKQVTLEAKKAKESGSDDEMDVCLKHFSNAMTWLIKFKTHDFENVMNAFLEVKTECPYCVELMFHDRLSCPALDQFLADNAEFLQAQIDFFKV